MYDINYSLLAIACEYWSHVSYQLIYSRKRGEEE